MGGHMSNTTGVGRPSDRRGRSRLPAVPGLDPELDVRHASPRLYRSSRWRSSWSRVLDPVQLAHDAPWWRRYQAALAVSVIYAVLAGIYIVVSSTAVSDSDGANAEIWKGLGFVVLTALLLGVLLAEHGRRSAAAASRLRFLTESAGDLTYRYRRWPTVGFEYMSPAVADWVGLTADDHYANPEIGLHLVHPDDRQRLSQLLARGRSDGPVQLRWVAPDGRVLYTEHAFVEVRDRRGRIVAIDGRIRNVTAERHDRAESELGLAIWGWVTDDQVEARTAITRACDCIVQLLGVETAWVGVPLPDGSVRVEYAAGNASWVDDIEIRWDDGPLADGPSGRAIRDGEPVMMQTSDPGYAAWRQRAREAGVTAALAVPIRAQGRVVAVLTVLSRFGNPFDIAHIERFDRIAVRLAGAASRLTGSPASESRGSGGRWTATGVDVRAALDEGRVEPWWQPQVTLDGRIVAVEALVRVRDHDGSILTPAAILPAAEELGLMGVLGQTVRRRAIEEAGPWLAGGLERVCLNVSVAELLNPGFVAELEDLVGLNELRPDQVELELVETAPVDAAALRLLSRLSLLGFRLAVDDYGSGWASLGHLARVPARALKIDRVFIRDITTSERTRALVSSTCELGHALDLTTVAEGVETVDQAGMLRDMGCDLLQGFLFSPPTDRAGMEAMLRGEGTEQWPLFGAASTPR